MNVIISVAYRHPPRTTRIIPSRHPRTVQQVPGNLAPLGVTQHPIPTGYPRRAMPDVPAFALRPTRVRKACRDRGCLQPADQRTQLEIPLTRPGLARLPRRLASIPGRDHPGSAVLLGPPGPHQIRQQPADPPAVHHLRDHDNRATNTSTNSPTNAVTASSSPAQPTACASISARTTARSANPASAAAVHAAANAVWPTHAPTDNPADAAAPRISRSSSSEKRTTSCRPRGDPDCARRARPVATRPDGDRGHRSLRAHTRALAPSERPRSEHATRTQCEQRGSIASAISRSPVSGVFSLNETTSERTRRLSGAEDRDRVRFAQTARPHSGSNARSSVRASLFDRWRLDGPFEEGAGDVGIGDRGGGAEVEHRGQVQRVGSDGECLV
jgi:hypothetical protein